MTRSYFIVSCLSLGAIVLGLVVYFKAERSMPPDSQPPYSIKRRIEYSFTLQNETNRLVRDVQFWAHAPVKRTPTQLCESLEVSHPYELMQDDLGNQVLHLRFGEFPPYSAKIISIGVNLALSDIPSLTREQDLKAFLQAEKYIEADAPEITTVARKLKSQSEKETVRKVFDWVADNVKYAGYLRNERGALYAIKNRQGDCTELMHLFAALCRANGIPARGVSGYVSEKDGILKPSDYHNWAEFYQDGRWQLADPQRKVFAQNPSHYVATCLMKESDGNLIKSTQRFRVEGEGLKARMN